MVTYVTKGSMIKIGKLGTIAIPQESRGAAYNSCYLKFNKPKKISVTFHNLSGYDAHLFIRRSSDGNDEGIFYIASTEETYISFTKKDHQ